MLLLTDVAASPQTKSCILPKKALVLVMAELAGRQGVGSSSQRNKK